MAIPERSAPLLILASASPRRSALLTQIGVPHRVVPSLFEEHRLDGEPVERCVQRLAEQKALEVLARFTHNTLPVLGADTAVIVDDAMLGKPRERSEGLDMLARLSGREHVVLSAVALARPGALTATLCRSLVRFRALSRAECEAYWDSGEPHDKAGGYAIQGLGALFIQRLLGSYSAVMGLPLFETAALLKAANLAPHGSALWQA
jgi:septum formation protein